MCGVDWSDPQTLWLNLTNLGLGIITLICVGVAAYAGFAELAARWKKAAASEAEADPTMATHGFHTPELGFTMADGGEPEKLAEDNQPAEEKKRRRTRKS